MGSGDLGSRQDEIMRLVVWIVCRRFVRSERCLAGILHHLNVGFHIVGDMFDTFESVGPLQTGKGSEYFGLVVELCQPFGDEAGVPGGMNTIIRRMAEEVVSSILLPVEFSVTEKRDIKV